MVLVMSMVSIEITILKGLRPPLRSFVFDIFRNVMERLINAFGFAEMVAWSALLGTNGVPGADFVAFGPPDRRFCRLWADSSSCHQPSAHQEEVAEREQGEELGTVLGEAAVAGLHTTELAFDDAEGMLDPGPDHGDDAIDPFVEGTTSVSSTPLGRR